MTGGVEDLDAPMLLAAMAATVHRLVAAEGALLSAEPGQGSMQGGLVLLDPDQQGIAGLGGPREPLLLAMQGVGGEEHAGHAKPGDQPRHRWDLVRGTGRFMMSQDEGSITGEGAEHVSRLAVVQVIEAATQRLAIKGDGRHRLRLG